MARLWLVDLSRPNEPFAKQLCRSTTQRPVEHELELRSEQGCVLVRGGDPWEAINNARALVRKFAGVEASHDIAAAVARVTEGL